MKNNKKHSHQTPHAYAVNAYAYQERLRKEFEEKEKIIRADYQRQLDEKGTDDWKRNLVVSIMVFYELTGSRQKTEKFAMRLAGKLARFRDEGKTTDDLVAEVARMTDIELEIQE